MRTKNKSKGQYLGSTLKNEQTRKYPVSARWWAGERDEEGGAEKQFKSACVTQGRLTLQIMHQCLRHLGQCAKGKCKYGILVDDVHDVAFPRFRLELRYIEGVI